MSDAVRDDDLLGRLRQADPVDPAELERVVAPLRERVKARAIALGSTPSEPIPAGDRVAVEAGAGGRGGRGIGRGSSPGRGAAAGRGASPRRRRWLPLGFASLGCAAVLAAVLLLTGGSVGSGPGTSSGYAEAAVKVAEANPRLLITAPGWRVEQARSFRPTDGQLELGDGTHQVHLSWGPAAYRHQDLAAGPEGRTVKTWTETIADRKAVVSEQRLPQIGDYFSTVFPAEGGIFVELGGAFAKRSEWEALMASVRAVGVDEWLAAMPGEILRPGAFTAEITRLLHGVPVPPGFDAHAVLRPIQLTNRFQAGKKLTQAVTCEWVRRWDGARAGGDSAAAQEAATAMAGAKGWPVLLRMAHEKGYSGDTLPAPGYGWPTSIITIGRQMAAGRLEREARYVGGPEGVVKSGFAIPKGAAPPNQVKCVPPAAKAAP
jgi:hypothetical protein